MAADTSRLTALAEARKFVNALLQETDERGYGKYRAMKAEERVTLELSVASWILGENPGYC